jgi:two-component system, cell cycle sensor histidine kinase and response regulator CckA
MKDSPAGNGLPLVLVVDDDPGVRSLVSAFLELICCKVMTAADGLEAFQIYSALQHPLSLLVTDINMPRVDGITLAQRLVEIQPALRVVYMSGETELAKNRVSGSIWIRKPFDCVVFLTKVRQLLTLHATG